MQKKIRRCTAKIRQHHTTRDAPLRREYTASNKTEIQTFFAKNKGKKLPTYRPIPNNYERV
jgi:hypothetical protein